MEKRHRLKRFPVVVHKIEKKSYVVQEPARQKKGDIPVEKDLIIVSSITYAMKGKELLERAGFRAYITRLPRGIENVGCGYCIYVDRDTDRAERFLRQAGIRVSGRHRAAVS